MATPFGLIRTGQAGKHPAFEPFLTWKRFWISLLLSVLVCLITASAHRSTVFTDLEYWAYDFLVNHASNHPSSNHIVIVDFDDATFAALNRYPVPRSAVAQVIRAIAAGQPRVIGLDIFLSEERTAAEDQEMRDTLTAAGNVVVASQLAGGGLPAVTPLPYFCQPPASDSDPWYCKEDSPGALGHAFVNMPIDSDGFIRRMGLIGRASEAAISFPLFLAQQYTGEALQPFDRSAARFRSTLVPYANTNTHTVLIGSWNVASIPSISALAVLGGQVDATKFADKLVLVGQGSDAARDRHFTPLFRPRQADGSRWRLSGTQIQAAATQTLLEGTAISVLSSQLLWVGTSVFVILLVWLLLCLPLRYGLLAIALGVTAIYLVAQHLFSWHHIWIPFATTECAALLTLPATSSYQFLRERLLHSRTAAEREQMMGLFSRYVSPEVARQIWDRRSEVVLAGEERVATVLFSDIRNFTALTAGKPSPAVLRWLNEYLTAMEEVITAEGGFLNKFIGDGLMVLFGVPLSEGIENDAYAAVQAAQRMLDRVTGLNQRHNGNAERFPLQIGIGIHTGALTSGNVGSINRLEYSVIGETVNLASRLESLNKEFHTEIIMSEATAAAVRSKVPNLVDLGKTTVRGFEEQIRLYTLGRSHSKPMESHLSAAREAQ